MERKYYPINEGAKLAGLTTSDLIHFGATATLKIHALMPGIRAIDVFPIDDENPTRRVLTGPFEISKYDLRAYEAGADVPLERVYSGNKGDVEAWALEWFPRMSELNLVVMAKELERLLGASITNPSSTSDSFETPWLKIQRAAIAEFFSPRRELDAKKEEVTEWIKAQAAAAKIEYSDRIGDAIFTIIKPEDHNPRKRRGGTQ